MALPSPESYNDWREFARALTAALEASDPTAGGSISLVQYNQTLPPSVIPPVPEGWRPVWWSTGDALLYMGNSAYNPPTAPDLFQVDTGSLADTAVTLQKLADNSVDFDKLLDGAVGEAKLANLAVGEAKLKLAAVGTANIQLAAITTALIGDAQVLTAKIGDLQVVTSKIDELAVNEAKIANLAVTSAKIALLAVGNAHIQDAAITRAKIGSLAVGTAEIDDLSVTTGKMGLLSVGAAQIALLAVGTAQMGNLAVTTAKIDDLAVTEAKIDDLAVTSAKIDNAAITTAKIGDAEITSAKIASLIVDKLTSGNLDATIDVDTGLFRFTVAGSQLIIGNGFGSSDQFFLWYGAEQATENDCTESNAVVFLKTNGDAFFGGALAAGNIHNAVRTTLTSPTLDLELGPFSSLGGTRTILLSYSYYQQQVYDGNFTPTVSGTFDAQLVVESWDGAVWNNLTTLNLTGGSTISGGPGAWVVELSMGGSTTFADMSGGITILYRARLVSRNIAAVTPGTLGTLISSFVNQNTAISSTEI